MANLTITETIVPPPDVGPEADDGMGSVLVGLIIGFIVCFILIVIAGFIHSGSLRYNKESLPKASELSVQWLHSPSPQHHQQTLPAGHYTQPGSPMVPVYLRGTVPDFKTPRGQQPETYAPYSPSKTPPYPYRGHV
eukprot:TRINITY_DN7586_c2_g2_i1.p1 TRINITY_DN7586_c2_g2~~TRINITY_DN7586_c2_g2_i1.p1  ORF type:complete len:136 (+),score=21.09 TRINITY_DN7586_c2_g2_i1:122-529(+)